MYINWPLVIVLFVLSLPGVFIAMPRLISFLLSDSTDIIKRRFNRIAVLQTTVMVFIMSFAGALLSTKTGLKDPILEGLLAGTLGISSIWPIVLPTIFYSIFGILVFCGLYYYLLPKMMLSENDLVIMHRFRSSLRLDGLVLYGGVAEEVIARWGLINLSAFFVMLVLQQRNNFIVWSTIVVSSVIYAVGQIPAYIAAGCSSSRQFIRAVVILYVWQGIIFGFLFWYYGLLSAILAHMLFHILWAWYDKV